MSDTKFTPGPWSYEAEDHKGVYGFVIRGKEDPAMYYDAPIIGRAEFVAQHNRCHVVGAEAAEANARLIAAAPELLEALKQLLRPYGVADTGMVNAPAPLQTEFIAAVREAKDAIAKATGEPTE